MKLLIYLITFVMTVIFCLAQSDPNSIAKAFCNTTNCPPNESVACQFVSNSNVKCNGQIRKINEQLVVDLHNELRNEVALGRVRKYLSAVQMATMKYSPELAQMAEYNVKTCKFSRDKCRNTNNITLSGQNIFTTRATLNLNINNRDRYIKEAIRSWFNENIRGDMTYINSYSPGPQRVGQFTLMGKFDNNLVGCAYNTFTVRGGIGFISNNVLVTCNYGTDNIVGKPIYVSGPPASQCTNGTNPLYDGLCKGQ